MIREYASESLHLPSQYTSDIFSYITDIFNKTINYLYDKNYIKEFFSNIVSQKINFDNFQCPNHDLKNMFINFSFTFLIYAFIKKINRLLKGEKSIQFASSIEKKL